MDCCIDESENGTPAKKIFLETGFFIFVVQKDIG